MASKIQQTLGERVRKLREERGWSQKKLAAMIPDVLQQSIDQLERGMIAQPRYMPELAQVFCVRVEWLLTGKGNAQPARTKHEKDDFDSSLLVAVVTIVDRMLEAEGLHLDRTAKANLISAIYELMLSEEGDDRALETMAANVIGYEKVRLRGKR